MTMASPSPTALTDAERALLARLRISLDGLWVINMSRLERDVADTLLVRGLVRWHEAFLGLTASGRDATELRPSPRKS